MLISLFETMATFNINVHHYKYVIYKKSKKKNQTNSCLKESSPDIGTDKNASVVFESLFTPIIKPAKRLSDSFFQVCDSLEIQQLFLY